VTWFAVLFPLPIWPKAALPPMLSWQCRSRDRCGARRLGYWCHTGCPSGGSDASGADTAKGDAISRDLGQKVEAGAACSELVLDAPAVGLTYDAAPPPASAGGTIADGTYFLTAQVVYRTASGSTILLGRNKVVSAGASWQEVTGEPEPSSVNPDKRLTYALNATGTSLTLARTCPSAAQPETLQYTAEATRLTLFVQDSGKTIGTVFTKQ